MLLAKTKLNTIEVLTSKVLIALYINHDEFVSTKNMLREYNEMKKSIPKINTNNLKCCGINYPKSMETYCVSCKKHISVRNSSIRRTKEID